MSKRGKLMEVGGLLASARNPSTEDEVLEGGVEGVHGRVRRRPGPRPDPEKRVLKKYLVKLKPEHHEALRKAALQRALSGADRRSDASGVLRLLLDGWIAGGAKSP